MTKRYRIVKGGGWHLPYTIEVRGYLWGMPITKWVPFQSCATQEIAEQEVERLLAPIEIVKEY